MVLWGRRTKPPFFLGDFVEGDPDGTELSLFFEKFVGFFSLGEFGWVGEGVEGGSVVVVVVGGGGDGFFFRELDWFE